jgi:hypothetical protein
MSFFNDTFTDTNGTDLTAHTSDSGHDWLRATSSSAGGMQIQSNHAIGATGSWNTLIFYPDVAVPSADYSVVSTLEIVNTSINGSGSGIGARVDPTSASINGYFVRIENSIPQRIKLEKFVSSVGTNLGSRNYGFSLNDIFLVELTVEGTTITVYVYDVLDSVWVLPSGTSGSKTALFSVTDSSLSSAGKPAILTHRNFFHYDDFQATEVGALPTQIVEDELDFVSTATGTVGSELVEQALGFFSEATVFVIENNFEGITSSLGFEQLAFPASHPFADNSLELTDEATVIRRGIERLSHDLNFVTSAVGSLGVPWLPIPIAHDLGFVQSVRSTWFGQGNDTLTLTDLAEVSYGLESSLTLTGLAVGGVVRSLSSDLELIQDLNRVGSIWNRTCTDAIAFVSASNAYNPSDKCLARYGQRRAPVAPGRLTLRSVDGLNQVVLRNPQVDNGRRTSFERVLRETRGGKLIVYRDAIWPTVQSLLYTIVDAKTTMIVEFRNFLLATLGQEIILTDWLGEEWLGIVIQPDESFVEDGEDYWTFGFEFQGYKTGHLSVNQNLDLGSESTEEVI